MTPYQTPYTSRALLWTASLLGSIGISNAIPVEILPTADIQVTENTNGDSASGATNPELNTRTNENDRNEVILMRFDFTGLDRSTITTAEIQVTNFRGRDQRDVHFYGVNNGVRGYNVITSTDGPFTDNDWDEGSNQPTFSTAPGLEWDMDSTTRGLRLDRVTDLGETPVQSEDEGAILALATPEFKDFIVNHPDDIVTIILAMTATSNGQMRYASKEATSLQDGSMPAPEGTYAPRIVIDLTPVPNLSVDKPEAFQGDTLNFTWFAPVGASNLFLTPDGETPIDVSGDTDENGLGALALDAPADDKTYTLTYDFDGSSPSFEQTVTILDPFLTAAPDVAVADVTELDFTWRITPGADPVILEVADNAAGPFVDIEDVTFDTDETTGAGSFQYIPFPGETHFRITYEIGSVPQDPVTTSVEVDDKILEFNSATNTVGDPETVPRLLDGVSIYQDRTFNWASVPEQVMGAQFLSPFNDDKNSVGITTEVTASKDATVFIIVDNRVGNGEATDPTLPTLGAGVMDWAVTAGFADTGLKIEGAPGLFYSLFFRQTTMGENLTFLEQADGDTRVLYVVAAVSPQISNFTTFGASPLVINQGETTTLNWMVVPGSTVMIDQGVGDVTSDTDETTGVGSKEITPASTGEVIYTLSYDPPGEDPEETLGPVTVTVNAVGGSEDFVITEISRDSDTGAISFSWPAPDGVTDPGSLTDTVERSATLINDWAAVPGAVITITDGVVTCTDPTPLAIKGNYRVNRP